MLTLSWSVTPSTLRKNPNSAACTWDSTLSVIGQDHNHSWGSAPRLIWKLIALRCLKAPLLWPQSDKLTQNCVCFIIKPAEQHPVTSHLYFAIRVICISTCKTCYLYFASLVMLRSHTTTCKQQTVHINSAAGNRIRVAARRQHEMTAIVANAENLKSAEWQEENLLDL